MRSSAGTRGMWCAVRECLKHGKGWAWGGGTLQEASRARLGAWKQGGQPCGEKWAKRQAEGGQRGLAGGRGREGGCADAAPSLLSYCRPSAFILVREEALEGFEKRYDVMGLSSNRPLALLWEQTVGEQRQKPAAFTSATRWKSDRNRQISDTTTYMWNLKKMIKNELIYKTEMDSQT